MDVATWLRDLGLEDYAEAFRAHHIDGEVLPRLTAEDLMALGIVSIGHRRRLLDAIAALDRTGAAELPAPALGPAAAERRQLTVLFCDLVGSTELATRLDPEDLRGVMGAYHRCTAAVIERFDGHVAKYLGDGVLAYFGWPRAHEDDAERAVRAGLELVEAVARLEPQPDVRLQCRIGIATGPVVVGDLVGSGAARDEAVVGEVPNLAARLQALAAPGAVVISQATRRLVGGRFELDDLGPQRLKGFAEPLVAWRVAGEGRAEGRFEARQSAGLTPLVGREEQLALLLRLWRQASAGAGQVVLLSGEPGIGKSRLIRELRERIAAERHVRLTHQCSSYHQTSPLHPIIEHLERVAAFARDDPPEAQLAKFETLLARSTQRLAEAVPLIATLLGIPTGARYPPLDLTPQRQKQLTLEALLDQLAGLAAQQPILMVHEDVHWIDPTTQELLGLTIERIARLPVLMLITFRPEFTPPWPAQPHVSTLALSRLGPDQGSAMVERVVGAKALPDEVTTQIVAKTDGVPLFVEELTKTVLESGLLADAGDHYELSGPLPPLAIPSTLHDSLLARLDHLALAKEVAQIGAAIGREFSHALLAAVADRPEVELQATLDQLLESELIFRRGTPPEATYSFKHALVQDVAYGTLLKSRRQQLHARIVQVMEEQFPEIAESQPELLAHHFTQAGLLAEAAAYWHSAGQRALQNSATLEAIAQLTRGLEALSDLSESAGRDRLELDLQVTLGGAQLAARGWAVSETGQAYERARELCDRLGETGQVFPVLWGLTVFHINRGEPCQGREIAEQMLRSAERAGDVAAQVASHRALSAALYHLGEWRSTRNHLEQVVALYGAMPNPPPPPLYAADHRAMALAFLAPTLYVLGYPDQGRARREEALTYAQGLGHPHSLALVLSRLCEYHCITHEWPILQDLAQVLAELGAEQRFSHYLATAHIFGGCALAALGRIREGVALYHRGSAIRRVGFPLYEAVLAEAYHKAGELADALRLLDEALDRAERTGERWFEAELYRLKAEVILSCPEHDSGAAEGCFRQAMKVAQEQRARIWELRAATSLARLWRDQGRRAEAHDLLAPVYGWFTEGFDTADLKDARALLDELA
jgi:class 3 adenylate cyclase/predicted ATPase